MYPYPMTGFSFFEETHVWTDGFWGTMGVPEKTISVTFKDTTALLPQNQSTQKLHVFVGEKFITSIIYTQDKSTADVIVPIPEEDQHTPIILQFHTPDACTYLSDTRRMAVAFRTVELMRHKDMPAPSVPATTLTLAEDAVSTKEHKEQLDQTVRTYSLRSNITPQSPMYPHKMTGFSIPEPTHTWTDGCLSTIRIPPKTISVTFKDTQGLVSVFHPEQKLTVFINHRHIMRKTYTLNDITADISIAVPEDAQNDFAIIEFHMPDACTYNVVDPTSSACDRTMAVAFRTIELVTITELNTKKKMEALSARKAEKLAAVKFAQTNSEKKNPFLTPPTSDSEKKKNPFLKPRKNTYLSRELEKYSSRLEKLRDYQLCLDGKCNCVEEHVKDAGTSMAERDAANDTIRALCKKIATITAATVMRANGTNAVEAVVSTETIVVDGGANNTLQREIDLAFAGLDTIEQTLVEHSETKLTKLTPTSSSTGKIVVGTVLGLVVGFAGGWYLQRPEKKYSPLGSVAVDHPYNPEQPHRDTFKDE